MSWKPCFALLSVCAAVTGCAVLHADAASEPAVVYRHRFIGTDAVAGLAVKPKAYEILSHTNAVAFRQLAEGRFATWMARQAGRPAAAKPLANALGLLLGADSAVELTRNGASWSVAVAAKLPPAQAEAVLVEIAAGADSLGLKNTGSKAHLVAVRDGAWVMATAGSGSAPAEGPLKARLKTLAARPVDPEKQAGANTPLLSVEANLPALAEQFGWPAFPIQLGQLDLVVAAQGEFLKTTGDATYPAPLNWSQAAWNVPTNLIHDPLVAFTAVRGLGPIVADQGLLKETLGRNLGSSQSYLWTISQLPFLTHFATAADRPEAELARLGDLLPARLNPVLAASGAGTAGWNSNKTVTRIDGLPLVAPQIGTTNDVSGGWLFGGLFPPVPLKEPAPDQLLAQFTRRNDVVFYDWEITQTRVGYWRVLSQLVPALGRTGGQPDVPSNRRAFSVTERFLQGMNDQLGNTITEIAVAGPKRLSINRKSDLGFTGFELVYLARWMADSSSSLGGQPGAAKGTAPAPGLPIPGGKP